MREGQPKEVDIFESEAGELHDYNVMGCTQYVEEWKFTLYIRYCSEEFDEDHEFYLLGLLEDVEKLSIGIGRDGV